MPRKSSEALITIPAQPVSIARVRAPSHLDDNARAVFIDLVSAAPADTFVPTDVPLLARYAETVWLARVALDGKRLADYMQLTKLQVSLARALRLAPSTRGHHSVTATKARQTRGGRGWEALLDG